MICPPCRDSLHSRCPELVRQAGAGLTIAERAGSAWCDCQHQPPAERA